MRFNKLFQKSNREKQFWEWFVANRENYQSLKDNPRLELLFDEFSKQLYKYDQRLAFEFSTNDEKPYELIISADGNKEVFPSVENLVSVAPDVPDWKIIPFRPRHGTGYGIEFGETKLGPEHIRFKLSGNGDKVGLSLFFIEMAPTDLVKSAAFLLLDTILGEYDMETKVGFIEWFQLDPNGDSSELKPFEQLPQAFDAFYEMIRGK